MKIAVFSDAHGRSDFMQDVISDQGPDCIFFLGDGLDDLDRIERRNPTLAIVRVRGNCDRVSPFNPDPPPIWREVTLEGVHFVLAHGHTYGVKYDMAGMVTLAQSVRAQVAVFGHTHEPYLEQKHGIWLLNPGSCGYFHPSFAMITLTGAQDLQCQLFGPYDTGEYTPAARAH